MSTNTYLSEALAHAAARSAAPAPARPTTGAKTPARPTTAGKTPARLEPATPIVESPACATPDDESPIVPARPAPRSSSKTRRAKRPALIEEEASRREKLEDLVGVMIHTARNWFGEGAITPRREIWEVDSRLPFLQPDGGEVAAEDIRQMRDLFTQLFKTYGAIRKLVRERNIE